MIQDLHTHTYYSFCGKDSPEAVIKKAIESGIEVMGICDHNYGIAMNYPSIIFSDMKQKIKLYQDSLMRYFEHIKLLSQKYQDYIKVLCGIEIATLDTGNSLLPDEIDVSMFDYCLIEHLDKEGTVVDDLFKFASRCGCRYKGVAHTDLPAYIKSKGIDIKSYFERMAKENIFWEMNVNYDSIHSFNEYKYVNEFFKNEELINFVRESGIKISVGFDGHALEEYRADRVKQTCRKLEDMSISILKI